MLCTESFNNSLVFPGKYHHLSIILSDDFMSSQVTGISDFQWLSSVAAQCSYDMNFFAPIISRLILQSCSSCPYTENATNPNIFVPINHGQFVLQSFFRGGRSPYSSSSPM